ncbi:MAG: hypothetical protein GX221_02400 [Candidatus Riflebacteria bacterium]|nr:hypothetical protein [Candidatus Riflebacteria bacterium]
MKKIFYRHIAVCMLFGLAAVLISPRAVRADGSWLSYFRKDSLLNTYKTTYALVDDSVWRGTNGEGIKVFGKGKTMELKPSKNISGNSNKAYYDRITSLSYHTASDTVWIGTSIGLASCDSAGKSWKFYNDRKAPNSTVRSIEIAENGVLWVATAAGVYSFSEGVWKFFNSSNGLSQDSIHSIKLAGETVFAATVGGAVDRYDGQGRWVNVIPFEN